MKTVINENRLFRDAHNALISGVCSGLAKHLNINAWWVRGASIVGFIVAPFAVGLAYVLAILLLRYK